MAIIKCKMCGGDLVLVENQSVAECEYCGSRQTVPMADDEKKLIQFERAERLRRNCEFDKAAGLYEAIVSDFRQEAEAYWGLVLCKYGIEYVDDPATGKKIPTCHRSSFDSIMEDSDFEQALENADSVARRVYREEAKQIEEIRKGIIAVSANEQPYDIFICYKETDENGDRTLDSVLAQDIYDALTEKGYRTFFARISLEDKLGVEYEPYIFAALNSAKIMLAVGTDYEFYNAVWVKNEWSRFLKLMTKDKAKHLIPCFKGIDAYDMPREFAKLQAQDLGKVGAMQDLLRGIEKLLPKQKNTNVIQEKVVVGTAGGNNKVTALLERGNMALEDGDWAKADSFFEDVLNNDAHNAQAYMGKTLAQEKCRTMDALVRKRRDMHQNAASEKLYIQEKTVHITEMAEKFSLLGYVKQYAIRDVYSFDLSYTSEVSGRQRQYHEEEIWWQNHKQLSRAEKFAMGAVAEHLQSEKKHLFAQLADRVKKAQEADARSIAKLEAAYDAHIAKADAEAEKLYNDGLERREKEYQNYLRIAKNEENIDQLKQAEIFFRNNRAYKDSKNLIEHCQKRIADEQAKIDAENERQRVIAEQKRKAQQKRNKTIAMIAAACAVLAVAVVLLVTQVIIPGNAYKEAVALMENGQYEEAIVAFEVLGDFKDSVEKNEECKLAILEEQYNVAVALMNDGKYEEAIAAFHELSDYRDSADLIAGSNEAIEELQKKAQYDTAEVLYNSEKYEEAYYTYIGLNGYKDSADKAYSAHKQILLQADVGDYIPFGKYEQDNNTSNKKETIKWKVLHRQDGKLLLISKYALECKKYNETNEEVTWETCSLRKWLNGTFLNTAFSDEEKRQIIWSNVSADPRRFGDKTDPGNDTQDYIFCLSINEVLQYMPEVDDRICQPTKLAEINGVKKYDGNCWWWCRTPGANHKYAATISGGGDTIKAGHIYDLGSSVNISIDGVRPALWITIEE